jgi:hypothetical protein
MCTLSFISLLWKRSEERRLVSAAETSGLYICNSFDPISHDYLFLNYFPVAGFMKPSSVAQVTVNLYLEIRATCLLPLPGHLMLFRQVCQLFGCQNSFVPVSFRGPLEHSGLFKIRQVCRLLAILSQQGRAFTVPMIIWLQPLFLNQESRICFKM